MKETQDTAPGVEGHVFATPLGWVGIAAGERGLVATTLPRASADAARGKLQDEVARARARAAEGAGQPLVPFAWRARLARGTLLASLKADLERYFAGNRVDLSGHPVDLGGQTPFRRRILEATRRVPYGCTVTYGQLARECGCGRAARAVGGTMANNPLPLVIPCHRVLASNGLGGFGGRLDLKRRLLAIEAQGLKAAATSSRSAPRG